MVKKEKLRTPEWILEGYNSKEEYEKAKGSSSTKSKSSKKKTFRIKLCPKCGSDNVGVILGKEEGKGYGEWECHKCKWTGTDVKVKEVGEEELLEFLDD